MRLAPACLFAVVLAACGSSPEQDEPSGKPKPGKPPNAVGSFTIQLPEETLAPGDEITPCYVFPLEIEGPSTFVNAAVLKTGPGLHHGNITTRPKTGEGMRPCEDDIGGEALDVVAGGSVLFGSSTQLVGEEWRRFPNDMAYQVKEGFEIVARMHYLNTTSQTLTVAPSYDWYTIPESDVTEVLGPIFWAIRNFEIPPQSEHTVSTECNFARPMQIVEAMPHMHALGTHFGASIVGGPNDGSAFLDEKGYDPEGSIRVFEPPVNLDGSDGVRFSCTWKNPFDKQIVEGIGDNEMCMMFGYAFPVENAYTAVATPNGPCIELTP